MTSRDLGMDPLGSSDWISWIRTFWKSTNFDFWTSSMNLDLLLHTGFLHTEGWVYLNCCSTPETTVWQSAQVKTPDTNSAKKDWKQLSNIFPKLGVHKFRSLLVFSISDPKRNARSLLTSVSDAAFYVLSHGGLGFALHGSFFNLFAISKNSSTAYQNLWNTSGYCSCHGEQNACNPTT